MTRISQREKLLSKYDDLFGIKESTSSAREPSIIPSRSCFFERIDKLPWSGGMASRMNNKGDITEHSLEGLFVNRPKDAWPALAIELGLVADYSTICPKCFVRGRNVCELKSKPPSKVTNDTHD
jgi:hypothetical protein